MFDVFPVPALRDNYIWVVKNKATQYIAIVDPGEAVPLLQRIDTECWIPAAILVTHHHWDHTDGIARLIERYPVPVYAPAREQVQHASHRLSEGHQLTITEIGLCLDVLDVPGHTAGAISYYGHGMVFTGDTLFAAGCGRLFEGTASQMYASLNKLKQLPENTQIYCGHEYTRANLQFAQCVEPENLTIARRLQICMRQQSDPIIPTTLAAELVTNPFLRCAEKAVIESVNKYVGRLTSDAIEVFAALRSWKDSYRGDNDVLNN